jgi:predicted esterase
VLESHRIEVPRTARYHLRAEGAEPAREAWVLLHGYGQLALPFLESAGALAGPGRLLVAPEGLSRFYLRRWSGPVGASWMTREEREVEIHDTVRYLDLVWEQVRARCSGDAVLRVLGFSQGAPAAARWAVHGRSAPAEVVCWGAGVPPDLDLEAHAARGRAPRWTFVRGERDDAEDRAAEEQGLARLAGIGAETRTWSFPGGHELDAGTLARLGRA